MKTFERLCGLKRLNHKGSLSTSQRYTKDKKDNQSLNLYKKKSSKERVLMDVRLKHCDKYIFYRSIYIRYIIFDAV
jgi:hypothetical protein